MDTINRFRDEYFFLSNFYPAPVKYEGITYANSEAAFQAQKCADKKDRMRFAALSAGDAKRLGRRVSLRSDWEAVKIEIMKEIVHSKFTQNDDLKEKLIALQDVYLEEGNDWGDRIWGTVRGSGQNLLGKILMEVRDELIREKQEEI